jgi:REP element-mobilizing transposase RayT
MRNRPPASSVVQMPIPLRLQAPDVLYHVTSRGVDKQPLFGLHPADRAVFMKQLERTVIRYGWILHAYCLMGNHFHLVVETPNANIARGMQYLKSSYALWFNENKPREGHLFERRYWAHVLERDEHLFEVSRYVVLNPVRAGLCLHPSEWQWSSYRATAGLIAAPTFLTTEFILGIFSGPVPATRRYVQFVADALPPVGG